MAGGRGNWAAPARALALFAGVAVASVVVVVAGVRGFEYGFVHNPFFEPTAFPLVPLYALFGVLGALIAAVLALGALAAVWLLGLAALRALRRNR